MLEPIEKYLADTFNVFTSGSVTFNVSVVAMGGVTGFTSPGTGCTYGNRVPMT